MNEEQRAIAREIARKYLEEGDPLGWFEALYSQAGENTSVIPWADLEPGPKLIEWLNRPGVAASGKALIVGSGLGDDAEELSRRGFRTTGFDISESAIS